MKMKMLRVGILRLVALFTIAEVLVLFPGCARNNSTTTSGSNEQVGETNAAEAGLFVPIEQALSAAQSQNKLVMVDVYTDWCVWCKRMDHDVYPSADVQNALKQYFAASKVNAESSALHAFRGKEVTERDLATSWNVSGYPTILFLDSNGTVLDSLPGYVPPKDFAQILRYMGTRAYEHESFDQWQHEQG